jgi:hypothetical protein
VDEINRKTLTHAPFFAAKVSALIDTQMMDAPDLRRAHFHLILTTLDPRLSTSIPVTAGTKTLNRYSILPGKTFASSSKSKERHKILRLVSNDVVIQNLKTQKVRTVGIDQLLKEWSEQGFQEVSTLSEIIETVKAVLGPALGVFFTAALISWLTDKLSH